MENRKKLLNKIDSLQEKVKKYGNIELDKKKVENALREKGKLYETLV